MTVSIFIVPAVKGDAQQTRSSFCVDDLIKAMIRAMNTPHGIPVIRKHSPHA
jgi:nucleoside-diphosphate-sugar epimerase